MTLCYMLETKRGCPDAFTVTRYYQGKTYDLPQALAAAFINSGNALHLPEEDLHGFEGMSPATRIKLSEAVTMHTLPNPHMAGFNANLEARKAEEDAVNDALHERNVK